VKPLSVLLLTGANNHDWRRSAPFFRDLLQASGRFVVTLTEDPSAALTDPAAVARHELFFIDYNGPDWSNVARTNFLAAVRRGTGVAAVHATNNSFPHWEEFGRLLGLMWRQESGHGQFHEFEVRIDDGDHPITRGVAGFRTADELYHGLVRPPGTELRVLASAWSDAGRGGTGRWEPVLAVNQYGAGRVFYHALGHLWPGDPAAHAGNSLVALLNPAFRDTLLRGCEWAASGSVTPPAASAKG